MCNKTRTRIEPVFVHKVSPFVQDTHKLPHLQFKFTYGRALKNAVRTKEKLGDVVKVVQHFSYFYILVQLFTKKKYLSNIIPFPTWFNSIMNYHHPVTALSRSLINGSFDWKSPLFCFSSWEKLSGGLLLFHLMNEWKWFHGFHKL